MRDALITMQSGLLRGATPKGVLLATIAAVLLLALAPTPADHSAEVSLAYDPGPICATCV